MNDFLIKTAVRLNLKTINEDDIHRWINARNESMLVFASIHSNLKVSKHAIKALGSFIRDRAVRIHLVDLLNHPILAIALCASNTLQSHLSLNELSNDPKFDANYEMLQERIIHEENKTEYFQSFKHSFKPLRGNKSDMKRLAQVKKALKRPMR